LETVVDCAGLYSVMLIFTTQGTGRAA